MSTCMLFSRILRARMVKQWRNYLVYVCCIVSADINSCSPNLCPSLANTTGVCIDLAAPANGFNCTCQSGFEWNGIACVGEYKPVGVIQHTRGPIS